MMKIAPSPLPHRETGQSHELRLSGSIEFIVVVSMLVVLIFLQVMNMQSIDQIDKMQKLHGLQINELNSNILKGRP